MRSFVLVLGAEIFAIVPGCAQTRVFYNRWLFEDQSERRRRVACKPRY